MSTAGTVLLAGGTGMIGQTLSISLVERGYHVIVLSRNPPLRNAITEFARWDPEQGRMDMEAFLRADYIINLAGASVAEKRWTRSRKKLILDSRIQSAQTIVNYLNNYDHKVKAVVNSSAIGWYGPDSVIPNLQPFTENHPAYSDYLGNTCRQWEEAIDPVQQAGIRLVKLRTGIVLQKNQGALKEFEKPLKFKIAAILGSGNQVVSWIHIEDMCSLFMFALQNEFMSGAFNAVAPLPVSNKTLTLELAKQISTGTYLPIHVPAFLLKLVLGEMSIEVLKSCTVSARKVMDAGFKFEFGEIGNALRHLYAGHKL
jgi:uncharacterized protein (TIGR01777 family)